MRTEWSLKSANEQQRTERTITTPSHVLGMENEAQIEDDDIERGLTMHLTNQQSIQGKALKQSSSPRINSQSNKQLIVPLRGHHNHHLRTRLAQSFIRPFAFRLPSIGSRAAPFDFKHKWEITRLLQIAR